MSEDNININKPQVKQILPKYNNTKCMNNSPPRGDISLLTYTLLDTQALVSKYTREIEKLLSFKNFLSV